MPAFDRMATVTFSTKRPPSVVANKRGLPVENLTGERCTPLDPVDMDLTTFPTGERPQEKLQVFTKEGLDIEPGDLLVVGSTEYPVLSVEPWYWGPEDANTLKLTLKKGKVG